MADSESGMDEQRANVPSRSRQRRRYLAGYGGKDRPVAPLLQAGFHLFGDRILQVFSNKTSHMAT